MLIKKEGVIVEKNRKDRRAEKRNGGEPVPYRKVTLHLSGNSRQRRKILRGWKAGWVLNFWNGTELKRRFGGHNGPTEWEWYYGNIDFGCLRQGTAAVEAYRHVHNLVCKAWPLKEMRRLTFFEKRELRNSKMNS